MPTSLQVLADRLHEQGYFEQTPDQVIINEYQPVQGIALHTDCIPCFGNTVASLSLLSSVVMDLMNPMIAKNEVIRPRLSDQWRGQKIKRERRVSLTFRKVISLATFGCLCTVLDVNSLRTLN